MHSTSDNIKFTPYSDAIEVVDKMFVLLGSKYQVNLETSMRGKDFIFDTVQLMHYKCHKVNFKRGGSYIDSSEWIKKKKAIINTKNTDGKCFQYTSTAASNYEEIESHAERTSNIKLFINKYNWEGINYALKIDDWKMFEKNNPAIALIFCKLKKKKYVQLISQKLIQIMKSK